MRLVHVNWPREGGDSAVDNPLWDTHAGNADRLQDCLCPQFDVTFTALIDDLEQRGLLEETLVVAIGEFGRTPRINAVGGRDHWGRVFSLALAGAGIAGGQVLGASDKTGAFPTQDPIRPHDLTATIFHLLGVDPHGMFPDKTNRPHPITKGEPLLRVLGNRPAPLPCKAEGDPAFVPPYDDRKLLDTDFRSTKLLPCSPPSREKGWRRPRSLKPLAASHSAQRPSTESRLTSRSGSGTRMARRSPRSRRAGACFWLRGCAAGAAASIRSRCVLPAAGRRPNTSTQCLPSTSVVGSCCSGSRT